MNINILRIELFHIISLLCHHLCIISISLCQNFFVKIENLKHQIKYTSIVPTSNIRFQSTRNYIPIKHLIIPLEIQIGFLNIETANKTGTMNKFHEKRQFNTYYLRWIPVEHNYMSKIIHKGIVRNQSYLSLNGKNLHIIIELLVGPLDNFVYENEIVKCRDEFITYQIDDGKNQWKIPG